MNVNTKTVRNSNIELLRIISMLMIVCHHMLVQGVAQDVGKDCLSLQICDCFVIFGVNIFLLVSGYFLIKFTWRKLFHLLWICSFYKIFHLCFRAFYLGHDVSLFEWIAKPLGVMFSTGGWFMDIYLLLFFLSPLINKALTSMNKNELKVSIIILLLVNIVWGWMYGNSINTIGYSISQFIMMYFIGYGLKVLPKEIAPPIRTWSAIGFLLVILLNISFAVVTNLFGFANKVFDYNNPLVIMGAVCLFMIVITSKPFVSKSINIIASSVIAVYLVHHQGGFVDWYMGIIARVYANNEIALFAIMFMGIVVILFTGSIFVDQIRKITSPYIENLLLQIESVTIKPLYNKFIK